MKLSLPLLLLLVFSACSTTKRLNHSADQEQILAIMHQSAKDWNEGRLDLFMTVYDSAATFMMSAGPVGLARMRENYQKGFFNGDKPKQLLRYEDMLVRPLGKDYALLTGKFVLEGNNLQERRGNYTLIFVRRSNGWKMLHDHSG